MVMVTPNSFSMQWYPGGHEEQVDDAGPDIFPVSHVSHDNAPGDELNVPGEQSATREVKSDEDCVNGVRSDERGARVGSKVRIRVS